MLTLSDSTVCWISHAAQPQIDQNARWLLAGTTILTEMQEMSLTQPGTQNSELETTCMACS